MSGLKNLIFVTGRNTRQDACMRQMIDCAVRKGMDVHVIDYRNPDSFCGDAFHVFVSRPDCVLMTFHGNGTMLHAGDENIWEKHGIPVYSVMTGYTEEDAAVLSHPLRDFHVLATDRALGRMIARLHPTLTDVRFFPFGGIAGTEDNAGKTIDVLIAGDCERERSAYYDKIPFLDDDGITMITTCVSEMIASPGLSAEEAMAAYFEAGQESCSEEQFAGLLRTVRNDIEETVRRFFKQELVHALDTAGIPLTIYGKGWEAPDYFFGENTRIYPPAGEEERRDLVRDAKISVVFSDLHDGMPYGLADAMLAGSLCMTEENAYLAERYEEGNHLVFLNHTNPNQAAADIEYLLAHPDRLEEIARTGQRAVFAQDTWAHRLDALTKRIEGNTVQSDPRNEAAGINEIKKHHTDQTKEIVFLPVRREWWKTMEPVYRLAASDPDADVVVLPVKWHRKDDDGHVYEPHDEGEEIATLVPVTNETDYNIIQRHPDVIVTQFPYDDTNRDVGIDVPFFSENLKNHTDKLIYVPCYDADTPGKEDEISKKALRVLIEQPAVVHADMVLLPTAGMRELYIDTLSDIAGEDTRPVWEEKIRTTDTPDLDFLASLFHA